MQPIVEDFRSLPGFKKADIVVTTQERQYRKSTGLEEGLRSLMGLVISIVTDITYVFIDPRIDFEGRG